MKTYSIILITLFFITFLGVEKSIKVHGRQYCLNKYKNNNSAKVYLKKLEKLYITGKFYGNGEKDTIFQHNYSRLSKREIDSFPDPLKNEWDDIVMWFDNQQSFNYLVTNKKQSDTLSLGTGQGLYCLINIGDNNSDGKDEIAFVVDYCDFSQINTCAIYTLCNSRWTKLKEFKIHESAFYYTGESMPIFNEIKGFLEIKSNKWIYKDYLQEFNSKSGILEMKELKLNKCRKN